MYLVPQEKSVQILHYDWNDGFNQRHVIDCVMVITGLSVSIPWASVRSRAVPKALVLKGPCNFAKENQL